LEKRKNIIDKNGEEQALSKQILDKALEKRYSLFKANPKNKIINKKKIKRQKDDTLQEDDRYQKNPRVYGEEEQLSEQVLNKALEKRTNLIERNNTEQRLSKQVLDSALEKRQAIIDKKKASKVVELKDRLKSYFKGRKLDDKNQYKMLDDLRNKINEMKKSLGDEEDLDKYQEGLKALEDMMTTYDELDKRVSVTSGDFKRRLTDLSEEFNDQITFMYQPYTHGKAYTVYENFPEIYKLQLSARGKIDKLLKDFDFSKDKKERFSSKALAELSAELDKLQAFKERSHKTRDEDEILSDLEKRKEVALSSSKSVDDKGLPQKEKVGDKYVDPLTKKIVNNIERSYNTAVAEYAADKGTEYLFQDAPETMTDYIMSMKEKIQRFMDQANQDVTAIGPTMTEIAEQLMNQFEQSMTDVDRKMYEEHLAGEKKHVRKVLSEQFYKQMGLSLHSSTTSSDLLKQFVMDPTTFTSASAQDRFLRTPLGLRLGESQRLLGLAQNLVDLRQQMMGEALTRMNMEGVEDGVKFDLVATHLFPPSQVELKLKYLRSLKPDDRSKFMDGPFMKAVKSLVPGFDIENIDAGNFLDSVNQIQKETGDYLRKITGTGFESFTSLGDQISRLEFSLLSQVRNQPIEDQIKSKENRGDDAPPSDPDSGAVKVIDGVSYNPTYNPSTNNQIIRDQIDDNKLRNYTLTERSEKEAYVPMHVGASRFFFGKESYQSLAGQFDSLRPLIPKNPIKNPMSTITSIIGQYGEVLHIKKPKTSFTSHPALIQKEAIELSEMVNAYKAYISQTIGNYQQVDRMDTSEDQPQFPKEQQPELMQIEEAPQIQPAPRKKNIDPHAEGENVTDPLMSGVRGIMDRMQVERTTDVNRDIFSHPWG
jgi:hypothetical protein